MFDSETFANEAIEQIRQQIDGDAIIACSGGVDSVVATVLVSMAIGDQLLAVHVEIISVSAGTCAFLKVSGVSPAAGLKSGRSNQMRN